MHDREHLNYVVSLARLGMIFDGFIPTPTSFFLCFCFVKKIMRPHSSMHNGGRRNSLDDNSWTENVGEVFPTRNEVND
jgi:hypothetical protein